MNTGKIINEIILPGIEEHGFDIQLDSSLIGPNSVLDSLSLVTLLATIEEKISDVTGKHLTLANEAALSRSRSPFLNIHTLSEYILELLSNE